MEDHDSDKGVNYTPATHGNNKGSDENDNLFLSPNTGKQKNKFADVMLSPVRFGQ